jgi:flagellar basal-body rod protein FlgB
MEAVTSTALSLALDAAVLRQKAIASNIANANTVGYVRQTTNFDRQVERLNAGWQGGGGLRAEALRGVSVRIEPVAADGVTEPGVQLDTEMVDMAQNAVQYQTLLKGLERHYSILSSAISEGKK